MDIETMKACRDELIAARGFYRGITDEYEKNVKLGVIGGTKKASDTEAMIALMFGIDLLNYYIGDTEDKTFAKFRLKYNSDYKVCKKKYQKMIKECQDEFARYKLLPTDSMYYKALLLVLNLCAEFFK